MTARQAALLWPGTISERRVRQVFADLLECGLLVRDRCAIKYAPSNAHLLLVGATRGGRGNWEDLYALLPKGIRYIAHNLELPYAGARSRYNRSYSDGRREHAYLRNEFLALHGPGRRQHDPSQPRLDRFDAEGGVGRLEVPGRPGRSAKVVEPDGLMEISKPSHWSYPPDSAKRIRQAYFLESDTGSQYHVAEVADKIFRYSARFLNETEEPRDTNRGHPRVLFISPTHERTQTVRRLVKQAVSRWKRSPFQDLDTRRLREGHQQGALDLFCCTNLEVLRKRGVWANAYAYLCNREYGELF